MANTTGTLSTFSSMLIEDVLPGITDNLPGSVKMFEKFKESTDSYDTNGAIYPRIKVQRNTQAASYTDNGNLAQRGIHTVKRFTISEKYANIGFALTGPTIRRMTASNNNAGDILQQTEEDIRRSLANEYNRQCFGTGSGRKGLVFSAGGGDMVLDGQEKARYFNVGDFISVQEGNSSTSRGTSTVTAVDYSASTITAADPGSTADNDVIVPGQQGSGDAAASWDSDMIGLAAHVDDGTNVDAYQGVTRSTGYAAYKANVLSNSGTNRPLTEDLLYNGKILRTINSDYMDTDPMLITMDPGMRRTFAALFEGQIRFQPGKIEAGLTQEPTWDGIPLWIENDHPYNQINFLSQDTFRLYKAWDMKFLDEDGTILKFQNGSTDVDGFFGYLIASYELGCLVPSANTALKDITQTIFYRTAE